MTSRGNNRLYAYWTYFQNKKSIALANLGVARCSAVGNDRIKSKAVG
jgi:hypothetical protein